MYTDGAELIFDYASSSDDAELLTVVRTGQELADVIPRYLKRSTHVTTAELRACAYPPTPRPRSGSTRPRPAASR